jgi:hypothetical protein
MEALTSDEKTLLMLEIYRGRAAAVELTDDERAEAVCKVAQIEAEIRASAVRRSEPEYQRHLDWCRSLWAKRWDQEYVPALVCGGNGMGEYEDWDMPEVMSRRAKLHEQMRREGVVP